MERVAELSGEQRRALDRLRPSADGFGLYLAGGTAVAFYLEHRVSRDLDLFSREPTLDLEPLRATLVTLPGAEVTSITDAALRLRLGNVPVDIVRYPYRPLRPLEPGPNGFPVASLEDLATMKLSAAARRGIRRDFWDLFAMFQDGRLTWDRALTSYVERFGVSESDLYHVLRALSFFDDAEAEALLPDGLTPEAWSAIRAWFEVQAPAALRARLR